MEIDEAALRRDLGSAAFRLGEKAGRWKFVRLNFPYLYVLVELPKFGGCWPWILIKIECAGYPGNGPTGDFWHAVNDLRLPDAERPRGANGTVLDWFKDWGKGAIYHPIDRLAWDHWPNQHHELRWQPGYTIVDYLEVIHGLVHDPSNMGAALSEGAAHVPQEPVGPVERGAA